MHGPREALSGARKLVLVAIAIASLTAFTAQSVSFAKSKHVKFPKGVNALVTVGKAGVVAPSNFLGVSLEMSGLCNFLRTDAVAPTRLENLFHDLGVAVMKVGGKSSDYSTWKQDGTARCSEKGTVVNSSLVDSFFSFARRAGIQVVWGLPLVRFNPTGAAAEAKYVDSVGSSNLAYWSIGNEPDIWTGAGARPKHWTFAQYFAQWKQTRSDVLAAVPGSKFAGPEQCCVNGLFDKFASSAHGMVSALSWHLYAGSRTNLTASYLLSTAAANKVASRAEAYWKTDSHSAKVPLWITEVNTFPKGGVKGVSDGFVSGLWLGDFLFQTANLHIAQVEVQQIDGSAIYDPINLLGQPMPIFYGLLFYHSAVPDGSRFISSKAVTSSKSMNLRSYAVRTQSGGLNVVLFNKGTGSATAQITGGAAYHSARMYRMQAPKLSSKLVTIGGHAVDLDGTLAAPSTTSLSMKAGVTSLKIPAGSAACVELR